MIFQQCNAVSTNFELGTASGVGWVPQSVCCINLEKIIYSLGAGSIVV